jgi:aryl carrier-like protein
MNTRDQVRQRVASLLRDRGDDQPFEDTERLVSAGRLDSFEVMEMAAYLEVQHGLDFARIGFDPEDFDSVDAIACMMDREQRRAAGAQVSAGGA